MALGYHGQKVKSTFNFQSAERVPDSERSKNPDAFTKPAIRISPICGRVMRRNPHPAFVDGRSFHGKRSWTQGHTQAGVRRVFRVSLRLLPEATQVRSPSKLYIFSFELFPPTDLGTLPGTHAFFLKKVQTVLHVIVWIQEVQAHFFCTL